MSRRGRRIHAGLARTCAGPGRNPSVARRQETGSPAISAEDRRSDLRRRAGPVARWRAPGRCRSGCPTRKCADRRRKAASFCPNANSRERGPPPGRSRRPAPSARCRAALRSRAGRNRRNRIPCAPTPLRRGGSRCSNRRPRCLPRSSAAQGAKCNRAALRPWFPCRRKGQATTGIRGYPAGRRSCRAPVQPSLRQAANAIPEGVGRADRRGLSDRCARAPLPKRRVW
ncbi:hypothetical protein D9M70_478180 [compost metagenome]